MKIIQLITAYQLGGAERVATNLSLYLSKNKIETLMVAVLSNKDIFGEAIICELNSASVGNIVLSHGKFKPLALTVAIKNLVFLIRKEKPDIIHSHTDIPDFVLSCALRIISLLRIPLPKIVRTIHNVELWSMHRRIGTFAEKVYTDDYVVVISNAANIAYKSMRARMKLAESINVSKIYNGVKFTGNSKSNNINAVRKNGKVMILFAGRLEEQKGFDILVNAINLLDSSLYNLFELHVYGSGKDMTYKAKVKDEKLPIIFHGTVSNLNDIYPSFDLVVMPSRYEGIGLVALEAQALKVPVLATRVRGLIEAVPEKSPLLVNLDEVELSIKLKDIIKGKYNLSYLGDEANKFIIKKFDLEKTHSSYVEVYESSVE